MSKGIKLRLFYFRVEFDAYRSDLEFYSSAPQTEVNLAKQRETEEAFAHQKQEFEKLRSDVQIKLKFLDENRVSIHFGNSPKQGPYIYIYI